MLLAHVNCLCAHRNHCSVSVYACAVYKCLERHWLVSSLNYESTFVQHSLLAMYNVKFCYTLNVRTVHSTCRKTLKYSEIYTITLVNILRENECIRYSHRNVLKNVITEVCIVQFVKLYHLICFDMFLIFFSPQSRFRNTLSKSDIFFIIFPNFIC